MSEKDGRDHKDCKPDDCPLVFMMREIAKVSCVLHEELACLDGMYATIQSIHEFHRHIHPDARRDMETQCYQNIGGAFANIRVVCVEFDRRVRERIAKVGKKGGDNGDQSFKNN